MKKQNHLIEFYKCKENLIRCKCGWEGESALFKSHRNSFGEKTGRTLEFLDDIALSRFEYPIHGSLSALHGGWDRERFSYDK